MRCASSSRGCDDAAPAGSTEPVRSAAARSPNSAGAWLRQRPCSSRTSTRTRGRRRGAAPSMADARRASVRQHPFLGVNGVGRVVGRRGQAVADRHDASACAAPHRRLRTAAAGRAHGLARRPPGGWRDTSSSVAPTRLSPATRRWSRNDSGRPRASVASHIDRRATWTAMGLSVDAVEAVLRDEPAEAGPVGLGDVRREAGRARARAPPRRPPRDSGRRPRATRRCPSPDRARAGGGCRRGARALDQRLQACAGRGSSVIARGV